MTATIYVVAFIITGLVAWITIYITNKAYSRKWELDEPKSEHKHDTAPTTRSTIER